MKIVKNVVLYALFIAFVMPLNLTAQEAEKEEFKSMYLTVTTTYWNDDPNVSFKDWLATEKEYHEKVTMKNDLIAGSGFYTHYMSENNMELIMVTAYKTWEDIEKSGEVDSKLIEEGWPDEEKRKEFFDKKANYYSADHSDEIYATMPYAIPADLPKDKSLVYYVRKSDLAMDGKGSPKHFKEFFEKVTKKSQVLKGYYTHRHLWGSNAREFSEVFVIENLGQIEAYFDEMGKLVEEAWPDEENRKAFFEEFDKIFTGKHGDFVYRNVPELAK